MAILIDVGIHASIVSVNFVKLVSKLVGLSSTWIVMLFRLVLFVIVLLPWFIQMMLQWMFSKNITRNIPYGGGGSRFQRKLLDIYLPKLKEGELAPVYIFLSGGAWIIGYKAWGSMMGESIRRAGGLFVSIDVKNFPQGDIDDMISDSREAVLWTIKHIHEYGGNASQIHLIGQSAGAHILLCLLIKQLNDELNGIQVNWSISQVKGYIGISGPYDLVKLSSNMQNNGLDWSLISSIMKDTPSQYSPSRLVRKLTEIDLMTKLPFVLLFHGDQDKSVPLSTASDLIDAFKSVSWPSPVSLVVYKGWSHTDLIIERPFAGDDRLCDDIMRLTSNCHPIEGKDQKAWGVAISLARFVNPF